MKRKLLPLAVLVVAALAAPAAAGGQSVVPYLGGGIAMGSGDLADGTDNGWIAFAGLNVPLAAMPGVYWGVTGLYAHIPYEGNTDEATNIPGGFVNIGYTFGATTPSIVKPYVMAGIGAVQHRYEPGNTANPSDSETKFGASVGAGLNFVMPSVTPFVGAHYINAGSSTAFYTIYVGLAFGGGGTR